MLTNREQPWGQAYPAGLPAGFPSFDTGLDVFEYAVASAPEAPGLHFFDSSLSFREAGNAAHALAASLLERGVRAGDRIGLFLQNDPQFVIALHATWLAGGIAVALNPMMKAKELEFQLRDAGVDTLICLESLYAIGARLKARTALTRIIVTSEYDYLDRAPASLGERRPIECPGAIYLDRLLKEADGARVEPHAVRGEDVAVICYTSGTTGPPKGAMLTHRNLVYSEVYRYAMGITGDDVVMGAAPLFHVTGITGHIILSRICAAPLVLFHRFDAGEFWRMVERHRATHSFLALTAYIALLEDDGVRDRDISSLHRVFTGGAPVSPRVVDRFESATGQYMHNTYGMTETSCATHIVPYGSRAPIDPDTKAIAVGLPAPNVAAAVVDLQTGDPCPPGEIGEIVVAGPTVVPGYWRKEDQTERAMGDGMMRTGDVGLADDDGWLYLVDRTKDMIVASGYKVWPREVEDVLYEHPAVLEAAVVGVEDEYRGETVKAFVSLRPGYRLEGKGELIEYCRARMAAYKYPRSIEVVEILPKTATGKLQRNILRGGRAS